MKKNIYSIWQTLKFKLIKIPNFHSKRGSKAVRCVTNAHVHSWFSEMSTYQPFSVTLVTALINTFDTKLFQVVHKLCSGFRCDCHNKQAFGSPHSFK